MSMNKLAVLALLLTVSGCASGAMSESDCAGANWGSLGARDGLYGEPLKKFDDRVADCAEFGFEADRDSYLAGREGGLNSYCSPSGGFDAGRNGRDYQGVCSANGEASFLAEYQRGRKLFDLNKEYDDTLKALNEAEAREHSSRYNLRVSREKYLDPNLSQERSAELRADIDFYRRDLEQLEYDIPRLQRELRAAEGALDEYRDSLSRN